LEQKSAKYRNQAGTEEDEVIIEEGTHSFEVDDDDEDEQEEQGTSTSKSPKKSVFDKWAEKFKDFLDNAE